MFTVDIGNSALDNLSDHDLLDNSDKFVGMDNSKWDSNNTPKLPKVQKLMPTYYQPVKHTVFAPGAQQAPSNKHLDLLGLENVIVVPPSLITAIAVTNPSLFFSSKRKQDGFKSPGTAQHLNVVQRKKAGKTKAQAKKR